MEILITGVGISNTHECNKELTKLVKDRKGLKTMPPWGLLLLHAGLKCSRQAALDLPQSYERRGISVSIGNGSWPEQIAEIQKNRKGSKTVNESLGQELHPLWLLKSLPNIPAARLAIETGSQGVCHTTSDGGLQAWRQGLREIQGGKMDMMLCGDICPQGTSATVFLMERAPSLDKRVSDKHTPSYNIQELEQDLTTLGLNGLAERILREISGE